MHAAPPSSIYLQPADFNLHPADFSLHVALFNTLRYVWTKILHVIGQFPQLYAKKLKNVHFWLKISTHGILEMLIPNPDLDFWNSDPKIHFWANLSPKIQSYPFCLNIGTHGISRMLILIPALVFWVSNPNFLFGQILAKKVNVVCFNWKLAHMISWGCWLLFQR